MYSLVKCIKSMVEGLINSLQQTPPIISGGVYQLKFRTRISHNEHKAKEPFYSLFKHSLHKASHDSSRS